MRVDNPKQKNESVLAEFESSDSRLVIVERDRIKYPIRLFLLMYYTYVRFEISSPIPSLSESVIVSLTKLRGVHIHTHT